MNRSRASLIGAIAVLAMFAASCSSPLAVGSGGSGGEAARLTVPPANVGKLVNPNSSAEVRALKTYLDQTYGKKIISGQMDQKYLQYIKDTTGKEPAMMGYDFNGLMPSQGGNTDADKAIAWVKNRNGIAQFMWHWISPDANGDFYTSNFSLSAALANPNGSSYKNMIRDIDLVAGQLKRLQDAKVPVLWRPLHEAEGGWFWWGKSGGDAAKKLYRLIYDRYVNFHKLNNLIWVWTSYGGTEKGNWYPGDDVVDMIVWDYEKPNSWSLYNSLFGNSGKLFGLGEEGKLPDPNTFAAKPWSYFLTWAYMVRDPAEDAQGKNSKAWLRQVYNDPRVVTLSDLPVKTFAANAGPDAVVSDADGDGFETVALDATGSTGGSSTIVAYTWREDSSILATGATANVALSVGVHTLTLEVRNDAGQTALDTVTVTVVTPPVSRGKPATSSSNESAALSAANAVDGNTSSTRWASASGVDGQWLTVDLQKSYDVSRVTLFWEAASARDYDLQISDDGTNFTRFDGRTGAAAGARTDVLTNAAKGRYVRVWGIARTNASWGYSLFEIEVSGTPTATSTPTPSATPTPTPSATPTPTPTPTPSVSPSPSPLPTPSPSVTPTPSPSPTTSPLPSALTATYSKNDWGSGFTATIVVKNVSSVAVTGGWKLTFTFPGNQTITNAWSAVATQTGAQVQLINVDYNETIAPGASISLGFNANYSGSNVDPTNLVVVAR